MDNLITFLIIIAVIVSIFKNLARKKQTMEANVAYDDYEEEDYEKYEEEVPESIKELWSKFQGKEAKKSAPPPVPVPQMNVLSDQVAYKKEKIEYKPIKHEKMDQKPIVHKPIVHAKVDEFKRSFHREEKVEKPVIISPVKKRERRRVRLTAKELKKAVILSEILAKPVSMRD